MSGKKKYRIVVTEKNYGVVTIEADSLGEATDLAENAYADGDVEWGKTDSWPASPSLGEATIFRDANAAGDIRQTVQTRTTGAVDIVAVNLESITKEN